MTAKENPTPADERRQGTGRLSIDEKDGSYLTPLVRQISAKTCGIRERETRKGHRRWIDEKRPFGLQASNLLHFIGLPLLQQGDLCFQFPPTRQSVGFPRAVANE